jgi:hypothetical protein
MAMASIPPSPSIIVTVALPVPVSHEDHGRVPVTVTIVLCGLDQSLNLSLGQVLPGAKLSVSLPPWGQLLVFRWLASPVVGSILLAFVSPLAVYWPDCQN